MTLKSQVRKESKTGGLTQSPGKQYSLGSLGVAASYVLDSDDRVQRITKQPIN